MKEMLAIAISIASKAHINQFDKGGKPYILHCLWVMNKVRHLNMKAMIIAVLHDVLEDTDYTEEMLLKEGISSDIVVCLNILDRNNYNTYDSYIKAVAGDLLCLEVKLRDLEHNSKITRLKSLRDKDFDRIVKYQKAYTYLKNWKTLYYE